MSTRLIAAARAIAAGLPKPKDIVTGEYDYTVPHRFGRVPTGLLNREVTELHAALSSAISAHFPAGVEGLAGRLAEQAANFDTHRDVWRRALEIAQAHAVVSSPDIDDKAFWAHEIAAFDRSFNAISSGALALHLTSQPLPQEGADCPVCGMSHLACRHPRAAPQPPLPSGALNALAALKPTIVWAIKQWREKMTPEELAQAILDAPPVRAAIAQAEAGTSGTSEPFGQLVEYNRGSRAFVKPGEVYPPTADGYTVRPLYAAPSPEPSRQGVEAMRNALEPFVREAKRIFAVETDGEISDNVQIWQSGSTNITRSQITYGDLRRAVAALSTPSTGSAER